MNIGVVKWSSIPIPEIGTPFYCILSTGEWWFSVRRRDGSVVRVRAGWAMRRFKKLYGKDRGGWGRG